jgi:hypothetical protein
MLVWVAVFAPRWDELLALGFDVFVSVAFVVDEHVGDDKDKDDGK